MKTTIIIEDGRVSVTVDDGENTVIKRELPGVDELFAPKLETLKVPDEVIPRVERHIRGEKHHSRHFSEKMCVQCGEPFTPTSGAQKKCSNCKSQDTPNEQNRDCEECGKSLGTKNPSARFCSGKCMKAQKKRKAAESNTPWCLRCHAFTDHETWDHPEGLPDTNLLRRRRPETTLDPVDKRPEITEFKDQWRCEACRELNRFCILHEELMADGKKPPINISQLP